MGALHLVCVLLLLSLYYVHGADNLGGCRNVEQERSLVTRGTRMDALDRRRSLSEFPFSNHEMKLLREARHPMNRCTPMRLLIGPMFVMEVTFLGLSLMPRSKTRKPNSMPLGLPKTYFWG